MKSDVNVPARATNTSTRPDSGGRVPAIPICFEVAGNPRPQPRPRAQVRGHRAHIYTPASCDGWKAIIWAEALKHRPLVPIQGPVIVMLEFALRRPKTATGLRHDWPPDLDNLAKPVLDVLTGLGYWANDGQVDELSASKFYADAEAGPGVTVDIQWQGNKQP